MKHLAWLVVVGCGGAAAPAPVANTAPPAAPALHVTELHVDVANHLQLQPACANVPPRRYAITLDGRDVATVEVRCATGFQAPAPRTGAPAFPVAPGVHRIGIRDVATGTTAQRAFRFPVLEPALDEAGRSAGSFVADQLLIHADGDRFTIDEPRVTTKGL